MSNSFLIDKLSSDTEDSKSLIDRINRSLDLIHRENQNLRLEIDRLRGKRRATDSNKVIVLNDIDDDDVERINPQRKKLNVEKEPLWKILNDDQTAIHPSLKESLLAFLEGMDGVVLKDIALDRAERENGISFVSSLVFTFVDKTKSNHLRNDIRDGIRHLCPPPTWDYLTIKWIEEAEDEEQPPTQELNIADESKCGIYDYQQYKSNLESDSFDDIEIEAMEAEVRAYGKNKWVNLTGWVRPKFVSVQFWKDLCTHQHNIKPLPISTFAERRKGLLIKIDEVGHLYARFNDQP